MEFTDKKRDEIFAVQLKKTTKKAGQVFLGKSFSYFLAFITGLIFARLLGPDIYGVYQLALTMTFTILIFTVFGMDAGLIRYLPIFKGKNKKEPTKGIINFSILFSFISSSIVAIILFLAKDFISCTIFNEPRLSKILPIFGFILVFYSLVTVISGVFYAEKEAPLFVFYKEILERIFLVFIFVLLYFYFDLRLIGIAIAKFLASLIVLFLTIKWVIKRFPFLLKRPFLPKINRKSFLVYSASLMLIGFTYFFMGQINNLLLGIYTVSKEVGFYSIGYVIASLVIFILVSFNSIFAPSISELYHAGDYKTLNREYSALTRLIWIFTLPIFLWVTIFSERILVIFGPEFVAAKWVLVFLAIGQFINAAVGPNGLMLSMSGHQKWEMFNGIAVACLNIVLNILLIPQLGAVGSAIASAIALSVVNIVKTIEVWYVMNMIPYNVKFIKPIIAGIVGAFGLYLLKNIIRPNLLTTFGAGIVGSIMVIGTVFLLGLENDDKILLEAIKNKISRET